MIKLEPYGANANDICRIREMHRTTSQFCESSKFNEPAGGSMPSWRIEDLQCLYYARRFPRDDRFLIGVNDENIELRLSRGDSSIAADHSLIAGVVQD